MRVINFFVALTLLSLCVVSFFASAMHEDEAGKYDWVAKRIGTPTSASLFVSPNKKSAFVATEANTVASLKLKNGVTNWRRVFGTEDEFVCVAPVENSGIVTVVAVTKSGIVHFLRGKDGANSAYPFSLGNEQTEILSCVNAGADGNSVYIVGNSVSGESTVSVYQADVTAPDAPRVSPLTHIPVKSQAVAVSAAASSTGTDEELFVLLKDGTYSWVELKQGGSMREFKKAKVGGGVSIDAAHSISTQGKISRRQALVSVNHQNTIAAQLGAAPGVLSAEGSNVVVSCDAEQNVALVGGALVSSIPCSSSEKINVLAVSEAESSNSDDQSASSFRVLFTTSDDGAVHFVATNPAKKAVTTFWSLPLEGTALPRDIALESATASSESGSSKFAIDTAVFVLSRYNRLYKLARTAAGQNEVTPVFVTDLKQEARSIVRVNEADGNVIIRLKDSSKPHIVTVDGVTGAILSITTGDSSNDGKKTAPGNYYDICKCRGVLTGYEILPDGSRVDTWKVRIQGKVASILSDHDIFSISSVEHYRGVPNRTSSTTEIRRRYPMANVIVVAFHDNLGALTVAAIDSLTGSTLVSSRHPDCPGDVRLAIAEHTVIYHFFNRAKRRYYVATWELFEHQTQVLLDSNMVSPALVAQSLVAKRRQFHSAQVRAPHVVSAVKNFPYGAVSLIGVTHTSQSIARKLVVFVLATGEAISLPLPSLWGIPLKQPEPKNEQEVAMANSVFVPYFDRLTNINRVARPQLFKSAPTKLESTSRILVAGLDLWYVPASAGKPFDRLDDEFNKKGLLMVCCLLPVVTLVLRYFAIRRSVNVAWS